MFCNDLSSMEVHSLEEIWFFLEERLK